MTTSFGSSRVRNPTQQQILLVQEIGHNWSTRRSHSTTAMPAYFHRCRAKKNLFRPLPYRHHQQRNVEDMLPPQTRYQLPDISRADHPKKSPPLDHPVRTLTERSSCQVLWRVHREAPWAGWSSGSWRHAEGCGQTNGMAALEKDASPGKLHALTQPILSTSARLPFGLLGNSSLGEAGISSGRSRLAEGFGCWAKNRALAVMESRKIWTYFGHGGWAGFAVAPAG